MGTTSRAWRVLPAAVAVLWVVLLFLTPSWRASSAGVATMRATGAMLVDLAASRVCHRRPERSFVVAAQPMPVCGRCTGLYVAGAVGLLAAAMAGTRRTSRIACAPRLRTVEGPLVWLLAAGLPTLLTWGLEVAGLWNPGTVLRALAALPLGLTVGWIVGRALGASREDRRL